MFVKFVHEIFYIKEDWNTFLKSSNRALQKITDFLKTYLKNYYKLLPID